VIIKTQQFVQKMFNGKTANISLQQQKGQEGGGGHFNLKELFAVCLSDDWSIKKKTIMYNS